MPFILAYQHYVHNHHLFVSLTYNMKKLSERLQTYFIPAWHGIVSKVKIEHELLLG